MSVDGVPPHRSPSAAPARNDIPVRGAVDLHVHCGPDIIARSVTGLQLAEEASTNAIMAIYLKSHVAPTVAQAAVVSDAVRSVRALGGIVLNRHVGGLNAEAVAACLRMGGRLVWMPTFHARADLRHFQRDDRDGLAIVDDRGRILPQIEEILALVAEYEVGLCTGHLSPRESELLVQRAFERGVRTVVVTHPLYASIRMDLDAQIRLAKEGAFIEHCWAQLQGDPPGVSEAEIAEAIQAVGPNRVVLSTDAGKTAYDKPADAMRKYQEMMSRRFPANDLRAMFRDNPATVLGIDQ